MEKLKAIGERIKKVFFLAKEKLIIAKDKIISLIHRLQERFGTIRLRLIAAGAVLLVILLIILLAHACSHSSAKTDSSSSHESSFVSKSENSEASSSSRDAVDVQAVIDQEGELYDLRMMIESVIAGYPGNWSVYVKNLDTNDCFSINDHIVYPASMIKLFAAGAVYQQIEEGLVDESAVYPTICDMVSHSLNEAFNSIVWYIGKTYITEWCAEHGYASTTQCHGLFPSTNGEGLETSNGYNTTCASDAGRMMESIYRGECVSKEASEKILDMMFDQEFRNKIPSGLPEGVKVANKTGDTDDVSHDAAIVYSDGADYVLVIMVEAYGFAYDLDPDFIELSGLVYSYFND
ncbi:MAG: serine hydrolase [Ruminococcus sp.]|nr:serine hydrolase [Ruminococcus sp.]